MDRTAEVVYLDTHAIVHLYKGETRKFSPAVRRALERCDLLVSPAAVLEMEVLHEIGRIKPTAAAVLEALSQEIGLRVCGMTFREVVEAAIQEAWTRDPFDRLIVANAKARNATLITKDEHMHDHYKKALW